MLINFRVSNYRSLKEPQTLDLRPVYRDDQPTLGVVALYGANASGKSNLLKAIRFMHDVVTDQNHWISDQKIQRTPFLLDSESPGKPTSFAVELLLNDIPYSYGFSSLDDGITEEWLHFFPRGKKRIVFERDGGSYRFGSSLSKSRASLLGEITTPKDLYLRAAAKAFKGESSQVLEWFSRFLWFADDERSSRSIQRRMTATLLHDSEMQGRVQRLLRAADFGIEQANYNDSAVSFEQDPEMQSGSFRLEQRPGAIKVLYGGEKPPNVPADFIMSVADPAGITFEHAGSTRAEIKLEDESRGTQTWFDIAGMVTNALSLGWTLIVDELDTSLHPLLLAQMIRLFQGEESNPNRAQLIFTTHDASLLGRPGGEEVLRRDEIWFAEKHPTSGETQIFPLTDFKPRSGLNWEKRYLGGALGAIPYTSSSLSDGSLIREENAV